jgi:hydroxymethylglutaryl-CoA reductase (NADPH)
MPPSPILVRPRARRLTVEGVPIVEAPRPKGNLALPQQPAASASGGVPSTIKENLSPVVNVTEDTASASSSSGTEDAPSTAATTVLEDDEPTPSAAIAPAKPRSVDEVLAVFASGIGAKSVSDEEVILLVQKGKLAAYSLEKLLKNNDRAVRIRRALICALWPDLILSSVC